MQVSGICGAPVMIGQWVTAPPALAVSYLGINRAETHPKITYLDQYSTGHHHSFAAFSGYWMTMVKNPFDRVNNSDSTREPRLLLASRGRTPCSKNARNPAEMT